MKAIATVLLVLFLIGCAKAPAKPEQASQPPTADVSSVQDEIVDIDSLDQDLNDAEIDTLGQDLENISW